MLSAEELQRYNRHIILPEFGLKGQEKLKVAKVLVIGAGGLGCPVLQYLAAAGVGTIGIIDDDVVSESNLQRQILFSVEDLNKSKVEIAAQKLFKQNPFVTFKTFKTRVTPENALEIIKDFDLVIDGSDNFPTRYLVNDACVILNKTLVFGSIFKFEGQVSVFNYTFPNGQKGPTYRCLFPEPPEAGQVPNCAEIGVLGVLPGMIGTLQANEAIKVITGIGEPLAGRLFVIDALSFRTNIIKFSAVLENFQIMELGNYEETCSTSLTESQEHEKGETFDDLFGEDNDLKSLTVESLKRKIDQGENLQLIDVREPHEYEICNLGGKLIPMNSIPQHIEEIDSDIPVIFYCHHGMRSEMIVKFLSEELGFKNVYNLEGGIHAWAIKIDKTMRKY